jgi:serine/threonine protein kinase
MLSNTAPSLNQIAYLSPEQVLASRNAIDALNPTATADMYSLGCLLYQMLSGNSPYGLDAYASVENWQDAIVNMPPLPLLEGLGIPDRLQAILWRCLAKQPEDRYANIQELRHDLFAVLSWYCR